MWRLFPFLLLLLACTPQTGSLSSPQTGLTGTYTRQIAISNDAHHVLMGHLIDTTQAGPQGGPQRDQRQRMLVIGARNDGVHRLTMRAAWSHGVELPFVSTSRRFDGCTHGHCRDRSVGLIVLSDALFAHAAVHGLSARLLGSASSIDIHVPAHLFSELPEYRAPPEV